MIIVFYTEQKLGNDIVILYVDYTLAIGYKLEMIDMIEFIKK